MIIELQKLFGMMDELNQYPLSLICVIFCL